MDPSSFQSSLSAAILPIYKDPECLPENSTPLNSSAQKTNAIGQNIGNTDEKTAPGTLASRTLKTLPLNTDNSEKVDEDGAAQSQPESQEGESEEQAPEGDNHNGYKENTALQTLPIVVIENSPDESCLKTAAKEPSVLQSAASSTVSAAGRLAGWLWQKGSGYASSAAATLAVGGYQAYDHRVFYGTERPNAAKLAKELESATGSPHLGKAISSVVPAIAELLTPYLTCWINDTLASHWIFSKVTGPQFTEALVNKARTRILEKTIEETLLSIAKNLIDYNKAHPLEGKDHSGNNAQVADVVAQLLDKIVGQIPAIDQNLSEAAAVNRKSERAEARVANLQQALKPLVSTVFEMVFPKQADSIMLPSPINQMIWNVIAEIFVGPPARDRTEAVEKILLKLTDLYGQIKAPLDQAENDRSTLAELPGGALLARLCKEFTEKTGPEAAVREFKAALTKNSRTYAALIMQSADSQGKKIIRITPPLEAWLQSWIANRIVDLGEIQSEQLSSLMRFAGKYVEAILVHALIKLSSAGGEDGSLENQEALSVITEKLLASMADNLREIGPSIERKHQEIESAKARLNSILQVDPALTSELAGQVKLELAGKETEFQELFRPISSELLRMAGLDHEEELPLPPFLRNLMQDLMKEALPKLLSSSYPTFKMYLNLALPSPLKEEESLRLSRLGGKDQLNRAIGQAMKSLKPAIDSHLAGLSRDIAAGGENPINQQLSQLGLNEDQKMLISTFIHQLGTSNSEAVQTLKSYALGTLQEIIAQACGRLAISDNAAPESYEGRDTLQAALLNMVKVVVRRIPEINQKYGEMIAELHEKERELQQLQRDNHEADGQSRALEKQIQDKKDGLDRLFQPIIDDLAAASGFKFAPDTGLSKIIRSIYEDLTLQKPLPEDLRQRLAALDPNGKLPEICMAASLILKDKLQEALPAMGQNIAKALNEELLHKHLAPEEQDWLGTVFANAVRTHDRSMEPVWGFVQSYSQKLLEHIFAHLALSYRPAEQNPAANYDVLSNIALQVIDMIGKHAQSCDRNGLTLDKRLSDTIRQMDGLPAGQEKEDLRSQLLGLLKPVALEILSSAGLPDANALPMPSFIRQALWDSMISKLLPEVLAGVYRDVRMQPGVSQVKLDQAERLDGHAELKEAIEVLSGNLTPFIFEALAKKGKVAAEEFKEALAGRGVDVIEKSWIENLLNNLANGKGNPAIKNAWAYIDQFLASRLYGAAVNAALANPPADQIEQKNSNILAKILFNALKVIRSDLADIQPRLDAAVKEYDSLAPLIAFMEMAKKVMKSKRADMIAQLRRIKDQHPALEHADKIAELEDSYIQEVQRVLAVPAHEHAKMAALARGFLQRPVADPVESDAEVMRTLMFGPLTCAMRAGGGGHAERAVDSAEDALAAQLKTAENRKLSILQASFGNAVRDILQLTGLDSDENSGLPGAGRLYDLSILRNVILPELFLGIYRDVTHPQNVRGAYVKRLNEFFYDPEALPVQNNPESSRHILIKSYRDISQFNEELWKRAGSADVAGFIGNACAVFSKDLAETVQRYLQARSMETAGDLSSLLPVQLNERGVKLVADAIKDLAGSNDEPVVQDALGYMQSIFETGLLKVFIKIAESTEPQLPRLPDEKANRFLLGNVIYRIFGILAKHRDAIKIRMLEAGRLPNGSPEKQKIIREIFKPFADDLIAVAGLNPLDDLPVPANLKQDLWESLTAKIIPDLLARMYIETTAWETEAEENQQNLKKIFGTTHPQNAVRVMAQFAAEAGKSFLASESEETASLLNAAFVRYFDRAGTEKAQQAAAYLGNIQDYAKEFLKNNVQELAINKDPAMDWVWPSANEYINAILMKVFSSIGGKIDAIEQNKPDFLADVTLNILKIFTDHITKINQIANRSNTEHAYNVSLAAILQGFQNPDANPANPDAYNVAESKEYLEAKVALQIAERTLASEKNAVRRKAAEARVAKAKEALDKIRKEKFFAPLAIKLLDLAGLKGPADMPFPSPVGEHLWELLKTELLPSILANLYQTILNHGTLDSMLLSSLNALNEALNTIPEEEEVALELHSEVDKKQAEFNKACGELVLALVNMVPQTMTKSVLKIDKVKKMTAESVGKAVRNQLGKWTMLKLIDQGLFKGLPSIAPGVWEGPTNREEFVPKAVANGKITNRSVPLQFNMPMNANEKAQQESLKQRKAKDIREELKQTLVKTLHDQISAIIQSFFSSNWKRFQQAIDKDIQKYCGNFGLDVKKFLDVIFDKIFFQAMGTLLQVICFPVYKLFWFFMDMHLGRKSEDIIKSLHMDIHERLLYSMTNEVFSMLKADRH